MTNDSIDQKPSAFNFLEKAFTTKLFLTINFEKVVFKEPTYKTQ